METFKIKPITNRYSEREIVKVVLPTAHLSFEDIIELYNQRYNVKGTPIGYIVTESGMEIKYEV